MELILVRHGQTALNREERVQGQSDAPLDEVGRRQAACVAARLGKLPLRAVFSSPLRRALETATAIAKPHGLAVRVEPGLIEMDVGDLDGITYQEMHARYPDLLQAWKKDAGAVRLPGGETVAEILARSWPVLRKALAGEGRGPAVLVSHAFILQSLVCKAMDIPLTRFDGVCHDLAAMTVLQFRNGRAAIMSLNDRCHLPSEA